MSSTSDTSRDAASDAKATSREAGQAASAATWGGH
jgi:hypothetical protein